MPEYTVAVIRSQVAMAVEAAEWRGRAAGPEEARELACRERAELAWAPVGEPEVGKWAYYTERAEAVTGGPGD